MMFRGLDEIVRHTEKQLFNVEERRLRTQWLMAAGSFHINSRRRILWVRKRQCSYPYYGLSGTMDYQGLGYRVK